MKRDIIDPLIRRIGTLLTGVIAAQVALDATQFSTIEAALTGLLLVSSDLLLSKYHGRTNK